MQMPPAVLVRLGRRQEEVVTPTTAPTMSRPSINHRPGVVPMRPTSSQVDLPGMELHPEFEQRLYLGGSGDGRHPDQTFDEHHVCHFE